MYALLSLSVFLLGAVLVSGEVPSLTLNTGDSAVSYFNATFAITASIDSPLVNCSFLCNGIPSS